MPEHYPTEFGTNWEHLVQQKLSRLREYVTLATINGKEKTFSQLGQQTMSKVTTRAGQTRTSDAPMEKRWIRPYPYDLANVFDEWDEEFLGEVTLPQSEIMQTHVNAYNRACDDVIVEGLSGVAYSGETGTTVNTIPNTQQVAVDYVLSGSTANSGLTLAKVIRAKHILGVNEVGEDDGEELIFAYTQQQLTDLLNNVNEVKSSDYNNVKALVDGEVDRWMGFKWVKLQRLPLNSSTDVRSCYAYAKSGVKFGDSGRRSHMDVLPANSHALQIRTVASLAALRMEEKKVVEVFCDESPA